MHMQVALVTGGGRGIGAAVVKGLRDRGLQVGSGDGWTAAAPLQNMAMT